MTMPPRNRQVINKELRARDNRERNGDSTASVERVPEWESEPPRRLLSTANPAQGVPRGEGVKEPQSFQVAGSRAVLGFWAGARRVGCALICMLLAGLPWLLPQLLLPHL